jgi:uncharacterized protein (TIGR02246 family)
VFELERSAKFRNVSANPQVAFTVRDVPDPDAGAGGRTLDGDPGIAEQVRLDDPPTAGVSAWIIRIHPRRLVSDNVAGPGMHTADLGEETARQEQARPVAGLAGAAAERGRRAVERQVEELRAGVGDGDAEIYNRHFAADAMWGSPYGATVEGYDSLHAIHARMHASGDRGQSRYRIVRVLTPAPNVALAHVRRDALDEHGDTIPSRRDEPRFSEMALYVLVRREGRWWLAAGQNTPINIDLGAVA